MFPPAPVTAPAPAPAPARASAARLLALVAALALAGCDTIPATGPSAGAIVAEATPAPDRLDGYTLVDIDAASVAPYRLVPRADRAEPTAARTQAQVRLAPGDVIRVVVSESKEGGLFAPLSAGGTTFPNLRVSEAGDISLPYVDRLAVRGLDTQAVEERIRARLKGTAFEPQVYVELVANRNNTVLVAGEVRQPGRVSLLDGPMTVIDAVARSGGLARPALQADAVIRRGRDVRRIPMTDVHNGRNVQLQAGDTLTLEPNVKVFNALGAVRKTGQIEFAKADPSVLDAVAQAEGLSDEAANPTGLFVFRLDEPRAWRDEQGNWHRASVVFRIDLRKPENLLVAQTMALRPGDTLYVTNAPAHDWLKLIKPIAASLIAIRNASGIASQFE